MRFLIDREGNFFFLEVPLLKLVGDNIGPLRCSHRGIRALDLMLRGITQTLSVVENFEIFYLASVLGLEMPFEKISLKNNERRRAIAAYCRVCWVPNYSEFSYYFDGISEVDYFELYKKITLKQDLSIEKMLSDLSISFEMNCNTIFLIDEENIKREVSYSFIRELNPEIDNLINYDENYGSYILLKISSKASLVVRDIIQDMYLGICFYEKDSKTINEVRFSCQYLSLAPINFSLSIFYEVYRIN